MDQCGKIGSKRRDEEVRIGTWCECGFTTKERVDWNLGLDCLGTSLLFQTFGLGVCLELCGAGASTQITAHKAKPSVSEHCSNSTNGQAAVAMLCRMVQGLLKITIETSRSNTRWSKPITIQPYRATHTHVCILYTLYIMYIYLYTVLYGILSHVVYLISRFIHRM